MGSVRVAIVGVGNCASSLVQGLEYYKDADESSRVPGLMSARRAVRGRGARRRSSRSPGNAG